MKAKIRGAELAYDVRGSGPALLLLHAFPLDASLIGPLGLFGLAAVVAASVYLADVRPAVKDAGRGGSRNMGPYGPW